MCLGYVPSFNPDSRSTNLSFTLEKKAALAMQIDIPIPILDLGSGHIAGQICDLMLRHGTQYIFVKYIPIKPLQTKKFNASRVGASTNI